MRGLVNRAGYEFFAGSGFTSDQHAFVVARDAINHAHESVHQGACQYQVYALKRTRDGVRHIIFFFLSSSRFTLNNPGF